MFNEEIKKSISQPQLIAPQEFCLPQEETLLFRLAIIEARRHQKRLGFPYLTAVSKCLSIFPARLISSTPPHDLLKICRAISHAFAIQNHSIRFISLNKKSVLSVVIVYAPTSEYELCSLRHIEAACSAICKQITINAISYISYKHVDGQMVHYFELKDISQFARIELKRKLALFLPKYIEKVQSLCHLPINEDDNLRNILLLKQHLKTAASIPQMVIHFHNLKKFHVEYLVTLVRNAKPLQEDLSVHPNIQLVQIIEAGSSRGNRKIEAFVLIASCPKNECMNPDFSIDYMKARNWALSSMRRAFGTVRDVNGGLFLQQQNFLQRVEQQLTLENPSLIPLFKDLYPSLLPSIIKNLLTVEQFIEGSGLLARMMRENKTALFLEEDFCTYITLKQREQISLSSLLQAGRMADLQTHELGICQTSSCDTTSFLLFICTPNEIAKQKFIDFLPH